MNPTAMIDIFKYLREPFYPSFDPAAQIDPHPQNPQSRGPAAGGEALLNIPYASRNRVEMQVSQVVHGIHMALSGSIGLCGLLLPTRSLFAFRIHLELTMGIDLVES